jgi:hypothetical protein
MGDVTPDDSVRLRSAGVDQLAVHAVEGARGTSADFKSHLQARSTIVLDSRSDERKLMRIPADVPRQHLLIPFEPSTSKDHVRSEKIMQQPIILPHLQPTNRPRIITHQANRFRLPVNVHIVVGVDVFEDLVDDGNAAAFGEDEVLIGVEFEEDVRFVVVHEFHAPLFEVAGADGSLLSKFLAVVFIGHAVADAAHFLNPVFVCGRVSN